MCQMQELAQMRRVFFEELDQQLGF